MPRHQEQSLIRKRRRRRWVERVVVLLLLMLAWSWIVAAIVIVHHSMSSSVTNHSMDTIQQQRQQQQTFPLLLFTCRRAEYLRQTLTDVFDYLPRDCSVGCPVIISQDGHEPSVEAVVKEFQRQYPNIPIWHYQHVPSPTLRLEPYKELSVHYKWAIPKVFDEVPSCQNIIILEEDLHLSPDFFSYFQRLAPLLDSNQDLLAISAYNDNGISGQVKNVTRVVPSDFFPGLGWMLSRKLWKQELAPKWPNGYWDDWLREPDQRQGRLILRPEVCVSCCAVLWSILHCYSHHLHYVYMYTIHCRYHEHFTLESRVAPVAINSVACLDECS
jgi:alpha-1,3-mannosyl-glycoprotein beta-1,2-N-acetylglucosaminyltransferase